MEIRDAEKADSGELSYLINLAGEGIPEYLWSRMVVGAGTPMAVGARRAAREDGNFSYRNARVCIENDALLGMILAYQQPDPYEPGDLSDYPDVVRPLVALEAQAPGSWYINAMATYKKHRGKGVARRLIEDTEIMARSRGCDRLSLIVASENTSAKNLYDYLGFKDVDTRPVVPYPGCLHGGTWILMSRRIDNL